MPWRDAHLVCKWALAKWIEGEGCSSIKLTLIVPAQMYVISSNLLLITMSTHAHKCVEKNVLWRGEMAHSVIQRMQEIDSQMVGKVRDEEIYNLQAPTYLKFDPNQIHNILFMKK